MGNKQLIKVYGERNTGTNYLSKLIDMNLDVEQLPGVVPDWLVNLQARFTAKEFVRDVYFSLTFPRNLGWKHMRVKAADELRRYPICSKELTFVTLTKNPYSWLLSLYRKPYHQEHRDKIDFETFIVTPWRSVGRDNAAREFSSPVELWNLKNASYIQLAEKFQVINLSFEDLLRDPEQLLEKIRDAVSCRWKGDKFGNYDQSTKEESKNTSFYRDYYLNEKWKAEFSTDAIAHVNKQLDAEVMTYFGYSKWVV